MPALDLPDTLSAAAYFTAGWQGLFLCLFLLRRPGDRSPANLALAGASLAFAASMADDFLTLIHAYQSLPAAITCIGNVLPSLIGPFIYLHVEAQMSGADWRFRRRHWRHAGCFLILLLFLLLALAFPVPAQAPIGKPSLAYLGSAALRVMSTLGAYLLTAGQSLFYLSSAIRLTRQSAGGNGDEDEARRSWLRLLLQILSGVWLLYLLDDGVQLLAGEARGAGIGLAVIAIGYALALYAMAWISLHRGAVFQRRPAAVLEQQIAPFVKYRKSAQTGDDAARLVAKIEAAIRQERLYRESGLSLPLLASRVGARPNAVSQALNQHLGLSYFDYLNRFRIEEAQSLLADPDKSEESVLAIAYAVGFNSKSTFNAAFKRIAGVTPSEFRKEKRPSR